MTCPAADPPARVAPIDAAKARGLSTRAVGTDGDVAAGLARAYHAIREAASRGETSCAYSPIWEDSVERQVRRRLVVDGFEFVEHPGPAQYHPTDTAWTEVRW